MTLQTAVTIFNILQDKYGSPNVVTSEIVHYFNLAVNEYLNRLFPDTQGGLANVESDSNTLALIQPLIFVISGISIPVGGLITNTTINTELSDTAGAGSKYFRILNVELYSDNTFYPIRFVKHNNFPKYRKNVFKSPLPTDPIWTMLSQGISIDGPLSSFATIQFTLIKVPKAYTTADLTADMEFPDYTVYNLIAIALKMAGIATRDEEMIQDARLTGVQIAQ